MVSTEEKKEPVKKTVTVKASWEFEVDVEGLSNKYVDIDGLAIDLTRRELKYLIDHGELSDEDFSYSIEQVLSYGGKHWR